MFPIVQFIATDKVLDMLDVLNMLDVQVQFLDYKVVKAPLIMYFSYSF